MSSASPGFGSILRSLVREARRRMLLVAVLFSVVASAALVIGLLLPKTWECYATLVPDATAIRPLMEGRSANNGENNDSHLLTMVQAVQVRKIMFEVLTFGGWLNGNLSPQEQEVLLVQLKSRLRLEITREGLIRINYRDSDPKRSFSITNKMVDILIREAAQAKEASSRETYEFVERQVKAFGSELSLAHEKLLAYYRSDSAPSASSAPAEAGFPAQGTRGTRPEPSDTDETPTGPLSIEDLATLRAEEATLSAQLARSRSEAAPSSEESRRAEEQLRARVEELRLEYEHLANSYTDDHPDVVRKRNDLKSAQQDLRRLEAARIHDGKAVAATAALDEQVASAARTRLEGVRALIAQASQPTPSRRLPRRLPRRHSITVARSAPVAEANLVDPDMRLVGQDSKLAELLRRYEATRAVYQDLLRKQETARLSLNLDMERKSATLSVQEPATMPVIASSLRVMHKSIIGIVLATVVPLGVLFVMVSFDGRVRSADQIERMAKVPMLVSIPYASSGDGRGRARLRKMLSLLLVASVLAAYVVAFVLTQTKVPR